MNTLRVSIKLLILFVWSVITTVSATYADAVTLTWCSPTRNIDESELTNLGGFTINYRNTPALNTQSKNLSLSDPSLRCTPSVGNCAGANECSTVVSGLLKGQRYYFSVIAYNTVVPSALSAPSTEVSILIPEIPTPTPTRTPTPSPTAGYGGGDSSSPKPSATPTTQPTRSPIVAPGKGSPTPNPAHPIDDKDGDGVTDGNDNCPDVSNADQVTTNSSRGIACSKRAICLDLDGDMLSELFIMEKSPRTKKSWLHGILSSNGESFELEYAHNEHPAIADYDGDGIADIGTLTDSKKGFSVTYRGSGGAFDVIKTLPRELDLALIGCDFDGDKQSDLSGISVKAQMLSILESGSGKIIDSELALKAQEQIKQVTCTRFNNKEKASLVLLVVDKSKSSLQHKIIILNTIGKRIAEVSVGQMPTNEIVLVKNATTKEQLIGHLSAREKNRSRLALYRLKGTSVKAVKSSSLTFKKLFDIEGMDDGSVIMLGNNKIITRASNIELNNITSLGHVSALSTNQRTTSTLLSCINPIMLK